MTQLIILDRDGVINQDSYNYIKSVDEFIFIPGSIQAIVDLTAAGYTIAVATNQSGVSRKLYSEQTLAAIHEKLVQTVEAAGGAIAVIESCIHLPEEHCSCRKPQPGMLLRIAERFQCSLTGVYFVGDRISDIKVARAVGANPIMIVSNMTNQSELTAYPEVPVYNSLADFVATLIK